ncbi:MAG: phosphate ABC transporter permease PstA [Acetatifactor sp.]
MNNDTLYQKRRRPAEAFIMAAIYGAASIAVLLLLGIIGYVFFKGFRVLSLEFLTTVTSSLKGTVGIAGNLLNTLYIIVITLLIATPIGVGGAIYLNEYAKPGRLVNMIEFTTETLSGIPSVIFGLFGMVFFGNALGLGYSLLNGSLTLTLMVLPLIVRNTQEALRTVPDSYRNGALGMGATKWYMIRTILLPSAKPGILTGVILAVGRIVGESAALLFTAGSARILPKLGANMAETLSRLGGKIVQPGGTLTIELYLQMQNGEYEVAFGIGCVLIVIVLLINLLLKVITGNARKYGKQ